MRSAKISALAVALFLGSMALAQAPTASTIPMNTVYVGADGKYESAPDTAILRFDIAAQDSTARAAYDKCSAAAEQVRQAIRSNGLDTKAAEIGFFAVQTLYDWKDPKHKVTGYRVVTNVSLKLHDFAKVAGIVQQMAEIDSTENQSLSYILENIESAKTKAAEDAVHRAHAEASAVAIAGGRTLGDLLYASVDVSQPIIPVQVRAMAAMSPAAAPPPAPTEG